MLTLEQMTPEQKIGRVLCVRASRLKPDLDFILEMIRNEAVGCVQAIVNDTAPEVIKTLREAADYPLLIVNDMERGYPPSGLPQVPLITLAACNNPEYVRAFATSIANPAKADGWSGCWGPVVDLMCNPADPLSAARKAGDSAEAVTDFAREVLKVFESYGFQGSAKHYPGGHISAVDTHMSEAINDLSEEELMRDHIAPYVTLWREGLLHGVMVDHARYPQIDPEYPASLSKKVIGLLRREGFDGLVYTDSLAMMGILQKYGEVNAMILALNAGNDVILPNYRTPTKEVYDAMIAAYYDGRIDKERLDEAVRHVMEAEVRYAATPAAPAPMPENIGEILDAVARDCITARCAEGLTPAIDPNERRLFVILTEVGYDPEGPAAEISLGNWYSPARVAEAVRERFPNAEIRMLPEFPKANENDVTLTAATAHDKVVFVSFCSTSCYVGADCLTRRVQTVIRSLHASGKIEALVHFGNPFAVAELPQMPRCLLGYHAPASQIHAFDVLTGKIPARGSFPFPKFM